MVFAKFLGPDVTFYDIKRKEEIIAFLDTKIKSVEKDPDRRCITTWNDYLNDIKYIFRWLYNTNKKTGDEYNENGGMASSDWDTPSFATIKKKKTKRLSPYLET
jgi:integrase/recombinase XerD